jgi:hypothetical protein
MQAVIIQDDYVAHPGINWSRLKHYYKSPAHYKCSPRKETKAFMEGRALHVAVLEPDTYGSRYVVAPDFDKRTKSGKKSADEFAEEHAEKGTLTQEQHDKIMRMRDAVFASKSGRRLIEQCTYKETGISWIHRETGVVCKARLDGWGDTCAIDIKSTVDASEDGFSREIAKYLYHGQAAYYSTPLRRPFVFVAVENTEPHAVACYHAGQEIAEPGTLLVDRLLRMHSRCVRTQEWPGYDDVIKEISLPRWAR